MKLEKILAVRSLGDDRYEGVGPAYPWGGLYGGQLIAQALMAAADTVADGRMVHSVHAHFIRRGENAEPVEYRVERERDGGSFSTRLVHAYQGERRLLAATLSFTTAFNNANKNARDMTDVPAPSGLNKTSDWFSQFERRGLPDSTQGCLSSSAWFIQPEDIAHTPNSAAAALAYMSDDLPTESVLLAEDEIPTSIDQYFSASLDHSIWFHGLLDPSDWILMDFQCAARAADRGLAQGRVFAASGALIATVSQEVLLRRKL
ncbi:MAG: acyl-CoA thioesterase [Oceanococcus sp.]